MTECPRCHGPVDVVEEFNVRAIRGTERAVLHVRLVACEPCKVVVEEDTWGTSVGELVEARAR